MAVTPLKMAPVIPERMVLSPGGTAQLAHSGGSWAHPPGGSKDRPTQGSRGRRSLELTHLCAPPWTETYSPSLVLRGTAAGSGSFQGLLVSPVPQAAVLTGPGAGGGPWTSNPQDKRFQCRGRSGTEGARGRAGQVPTALAKGEAAGPRGKGLG